MTRSGSMVRCAALCTLALAAAAPGWAQSAAAPASPAAGQPAAPAPPEPLPRFDVSGLLGARHVRLPSRDTDVYPYPRWTHRFALTGTFGVYWTPHLKTEAEIGSTVQSSYIETRAVDVPGQSFPAYLWIDHAVQETLVTGRLLYQFGENDWVHPFVGIGAIVSRQRDHEKRRPLTTRASPTSPEVVVADASDETFTDHDVLPEISYGVKFYPSARVFLRIDMTWAFGVDRALRVSWRGGAGIDF